MQVAQRSRKKLDLRRGPTYERLLDEGWIQKIANGDLSYNKAEDKLGINKGSLHKFVTTWKHDTALEAVPVPDTTPDLFTDLAKFTEAFFPELDVPDFHREWIAAIHKNAQECGQLLLLAPQRHGKALDAETEILTRERGWVRAFDVKVGDHIPGSDGGWTEVLGVHDQGVTEAVEVSFSDGSSIVTNPEHLWTARKRHSATKWYTRTSAELGEDLWETTAKGHRNAKWRIPITAPFEGDPSNDSLLPIHPYILGVWLGDGSSYKSEVTSMDPEILDRVATIYGEPTYEYKHGAAWTCGFTGGFYDALKRLGLIGDKHIPEMYLRASRDARECLLQGLMDTDGTVNVAAGSVSFCTTSPALYTGFCELVAGLGGVHRTYEKSPWYYDGSGERVGGKPAWDVAIRLPKEIAPFALDRKLELLPEVTNTTTPRRLIHDVSPVDRRTTVCFTVAAEDHLFCAGRDFIVTHNSEMLIRYCVMRICANPDISILWVSKTASLAKKMVGHVRAILEHHPLLADSVLGAGRSFKPGRTSGLSWTDEEFTVANRTRVRKTPTMVAIGTGGTIVGLDADEMILDDPQDHIRCQSPTQREKDKEWFFTDFASRKMEQTALSFIMSRQHMEDLPGLVMRDHAEDWEILTYQAHDSACVLPEKIKGASPTGKVVNPEHDEAGCVLWPKFRSYKWLMGRRRQDEAHFERNYQNNPRTDATTYITAEDIDNLRDRTRRVGDIPSGCRLIAGIDPAEAKPVAAVLWGYDGLHRHVIDAVEAPASVVGLRQILDTWPKRYGCFTFAFEKNIAQSWLLDEEVKRLIRSQRIHLKQFYTSRVNKNSNAIGPISMFQRMRTSPPEITIPGAPGEGMERIDRLVRSWLTFDPDYASHKHADDDLTMASWFPQITMDEWNKPQGRSMAVEYDAIGGL